jgi:hypothetical protein
MTKRTSKQEMEVWKKRVEELHAKEACCPGCAKARLVAEVVPSSPAVEDASGSMFSPICKRYHKIRRNMT